MTPWHDCTLVIMAKAPRAGRVKTRLAPTLSIPAIIDLYACLLADTIGLAKSLDGLEIAIMSPASDIEELSPIAGSGVCVIAQTGDGLAAALTSVFGHFAAARRRRVVAFNSDSPHLPASALLNAFDALNSCDLVIGPTDDGGYYLAGANTSHPGLFEGSPLGTANALEALLDRARRLNLSVQLIQPFYDVDVASDLNRLADDLSVAPERAPRTARWLAGWARTAPPQPTGGTGTLN